MSQIVTGFDNASRQMKDMVEILRTINGSNSGLPAPAGMRRHANQKQNDGQIDSSIKNGQKTKAFLNVPERIDEDNEDYQMTSQNTSPDQRHMQKELPRNRGNS